VPRTSPESRTGHEAEALELVAVEGGILHWHVRVERCCDELEARVRGLRGHPQPHVAHLPCPCEPPWLSTKCALSQCSRCSQPLHANEDVIVSLQLDPTYIGEEPGVIGATRAANEALLRRRILWPRFAERHPARRIHKAAEHLEVHHVHASGFQLAICA
jgi:hypothetical protein